MIPVEGALELVNEMLKKVIGENNLISNLIDQANFIAKLSSGKSLSFMEVLNEINTLAKMIIGK